MDARIRSFGGELPSLPKEAEEPVIGRGVLSQGSPDWEGQYEKSRIVMDDLKQIIKAAIFEVLAEVFKE